jgi:outer membrane protein TolC
LQLERAELQVRLEDQQALPDLGLSASVGLLGQGEDRAESLGEVASAGRPDLRVGLSFELPLSWDVQYARARGAQTDRQRRSLELDGAAVDVRFRLQDLRTTLDAQMRRLGLSQKSVELARLKLDAEEDRYKSGISSLEAVSRFQRDLDNALINERRARVDLLVNWSRLLEAEGVLHRELGIEVE